MYQKDVAIARRRISSEKARQRGGTPRLQSERERGKRWRSELAALGRARQRKSGERLVRGKKQAARGWRDCFGSSLGPKEAPLRKSGSH